MGIFLNVYLILWQSLYMKNMDMNVSSRPLYRHIAYEGEKDEQQNRTTN